MKTYEYIEVNNVRSFENRIELFNKMGKDGWELVLVRGGNNYVFKREIINESK